ncbi:hypothetical protein AB4345_05275 [Vibrio breoganii]
MQSIKTILLATLAVIIFVTYLMLAIPVYLGTVLVRTLKYRKACNQSFKFCYQTAVRMTNRDVASFKAMFDRIRANQVQSSLNN